jgi:glycosyltransferase involved in cell wall biosynthesis
VRRSPFIPGQRLLYVVNDPAFFVSHRMALGHYGKSLGLDVAVVAPDGSGREEIERAGIRFVPIPLARGSTSPRTEVRTLGALTAAIARERPTLVHDVTIKPVLYGGLASRVLRVPALVSSVSGLGYMFIAQGARARARRALVVAAYRRALGHPRSRVVFQNEDDRRDLVELGAVDSARTVVIRGGSGVDLSSYAPSPPPPGPPLVVLPARMLRDKGVVEFVEAARAVRRQGIDARFALVGGFHENPAALTRAEVEQLTADGVVEWWGHRTDMPAVLAQSSIVCLPSYREGTPRALLEAAAAGRAVVTTDVPGCRDAVVPNETALLASVRSSEDLARQLTVLLRDPTRRLAMGRAGRALAEREFDVKRIVSAIFDVYVCVWPAESVVTAGQRTR